MKMITITTAAGAITRCTARLMSLAPAQATAIADACDELLHDIQEAAKTNSQAARIAAPKQSGAPSHAKSGKVRIVQGLRSENEPPKNGGTCDASQAAYTDEDRNH